MIGIKPVDDYYSENPLIFNAIFHTLQRGDQLVCPPGESLENMLILQDTINDERNRHSSDAAEPAPAAAPGPAPTPTASQNNHEPQGQSAGCSQPSIIPNPASTSSVRRISAVCDVSIDSKNKSNLENISVRFLWRIGEGGGWYKLQYLPREILRVKEESGYFLFCVPSSHHAFIMRATVFHWGTKLSDLNFFLRRNFL